MSPSYLRLLRGLRLLFLTGSTIHRVFFLLFYYLSIHQRLAFCILFEILLVFNLRRRRAMAAHKSRLWRLTFVLAIFRVFILICLMVRDLSSSRRLLNLGIFSERFIIEIAGNFAIWRVVFFILSLLILWSIARNLRLWSLNRPNNVSRISLWINRNCVKWCIVKRLVLTARRIDRGATLVLIAFYDMLLRIDGMLEWFNEVLSVTIRRKRLFLLIINRNLLGQILVEHMFCLCPIMKTHVLLLTLEICSFIIMLRLNRCDLSTVLVPCLNPIKTLLRFLSLINMFVRR